jgi:hypothetical protein
MTNDVKFVGTNKLRYYGLGGLYMQQLEGDMTEERERLDRLAED